MQEKNTSNEYKEPQHFKELLQESSKHLVITGFQEQNEQNFVFGKYLSNITDKFKGYKLTFIISNNIEDWKDWMNINILEKGVFEYEEDTEYKIHEFMESIKVIEVSYGNMIIDWQYNGDYDEAFIAKILNYMYKSKIYDSDEFYEYEEDDLPNELQEILDDFGMSYDDLVQGVIEANHRLAKELSSLPKKVELTGGFYNSGEGFLEAVDILLQSVNIEAEILNGFIF